MLDLAAIYFAGFACTETAQWKHCCSLQVPERRFFSEEQRHLYTDPVQIWYTATRSRQQKENVSVDEKQGISSRQKTEISSKIPYGDCCEKRVQDLESGKKLSLDVACVGVLGL